MSWYLANEHGMIDQFASISGLRDLRAASEHLTTLADFFRDGETQSVPTCIAQLGQVEGDADVKSTAAGLAKLMKGESHVFITQGFDADHEARESGTEEDEPTGLNHPKHANVLGPLRTKAQRVMRSYFRRQKRLVLASIKPALRKLTESRPSSYDIDPYGNVINIREEYDLEAKQKTAKAIPDLLPLTLTDGMRIDYTKALTAALEGGYEGLAEELGSDSAIAEDVVQTYLADHSLTNLTGGLDETTVERLRNALADAYESGGDYEALVKAVQDEYAGFNDVRAGMIAQTEMNAAYNAGRKQLGLDMGFNEKAWDPDGTACPEICIPNVIAGWIPIEDDFESGDDAPPGHPNCDCSLSVRFNPHLEEAMKTLVPVYFSREEINQLRESARLSEGWVTLDGGEHVYIGADGKVLGGSAAHAQYVNDRDTTKKSIEPAQKPGENKSMDQHMGTGKLTPKSADKLHAAAKEFTALHRATGHEMNLAYVGSVQDAKPSAENSWRGVNHKDADASASRLDQIRAERKSAVVSLGRVAQSHGLTENPALASGLRVDQAFTSGKNTLTIKDGTANFVSAKAATSAQNRSAINARADRKNEM